MKVSIKVWREGKNIVVRNDKFHINTYGKNLETALKNFHDAFLVASGHKLTKKDKNSIDITLQMSYPIGQHLKSVEIAE